MKKIRYNILSFHGSDMEMGHSNGELYRFQANVDLGVFGDSIHCYENFSTIFIKSEKVDWYKIGKEVMNKVQESIHEKN